MIEDMLAFYGSSNSRCLFHVMNKPIELRDTNPTFSWTEDLGKVETLCSADSRTIHRAFIIYRTSGRNDFTLNLNPSSGGHVILSLYTEAFWLDVVKRRFRLGNSLTCCATLRIEENYSLYFIRSWYRLQHYRRTVWYARPTDHTFTGRPIFPAPQPKIMPQIYFYSRMAMSSAPGSAAVWKASRTSVYTYHV